MLTNHIDTKNLDPKTQEIIRYYNKITRQDGRYSEEEAYRLLGSQNLDGDEGKEFVDKVSYAKILAELHKKS
jgi:hypothetical protein